MSAFLFCLFICGGIWSFSCPIKIISIISGKWQWLWRYSMQRIQQKALLFLTKFISFILVWFSTYVIELHHCWKYCNFNIDSMDVKMDTFARHRTLSHMRTNKAWISKRDCALLTVYIYICPYSRKQVMGCMQTEDALIRQHKCLSLKLAYVDSYAYVFCCSDHDSQFELLKRWSVKARGTCKSCRFYVSLTLLNVYL